MESSFKSNKVRYKYTNKICFALAAVVCCGHLIIGRGFSFVPVDLLLDLLFYFILVGSKLNPTQN
jgi:Golgi nucleoside diphosphatase